MQQDYKYIYDFINKTSVICPTCSNKAIVKSNPENRNETNFICVNCGKTKKWEGKAGYYESGRNAINSIGIAIGQPFDCYFKFKLWYTKNFKGNILFAYNIEHLNFLENYIGDKIRERKTKEGQWRNGSLQSRLPKWMLESKNRSELLKAIKNLKNK